MPPKALAVDPPIQMGTSPKASAIASAKDMANQPGSPPRASVIDSRIQTDTSPKASVMDTAIDTAILTGRC